MRLPWGRLTRKMPRATATEADVVLMSLFNWSQSGEDEEDGI